MTGKTCPFFSVVIPCYNRSDHLRKTLSSVLIQEFGDYECIVIDDGSKEPSKIKHEVDRLNDKRFNYYYQPNGGACKARNHGIQKARGHFIALLDSDDIFLEHKLKDFYDLLKGETGNRNLFCFSQLIVERGEIKKWIKPSRGLGFNERMDEYLLCTHGWAQTSTIVLSSSLAKAVKFDESLPSSQDTDFAIRCWDYGASVKFLAKPYIIMNDIYDSSRVSKQKNYTPLLNWIDSNRRKLLSEKAYWAYRGWEIARIASYSNRFKGLYFYLQSIIHLPYSAKMSILILAQIVIPQDWYQKIATFVVKILGHKN